MRARKFGLSVYRQTEARSTWPLTRQRTYPYSVMSEVEFAAVADYKKQRQNGTDSDNPDRPFPQDGTFDWVLETDIPDFLKLPPRPNHYRARYTEGPKDKAWMEERDRNYLARRAREEVQQQDAGAGAATSAAELVDAADDGHVPTARAPTPADESRASAAPSESLASASSSSPATSSSP